MIRKIINVIFIFLVLGLLTLPFLSMVTGLEPTRKIAENRRLYSFPDTGGHFRQWTDLPGKLSLYFQDHYGFRNYLSYLHVRLMIGVLKVPIIKQMIIGKGQWLFWGGDGILDSYRTTAPLEKETLEKLTEIHERMYRYCAERWIHYFFVTPPNTFSVYPEYLPDFLTLPTKAISHSDQLIAYLRAHTPIPLVDLKPMLLSEKKGENSIQNNLINSITFIEKIMI